MIFALPQRVYFGVLYAVSALFLVTALISRDYQVILSIGCVYLVLLDKWYSYLSVFWSPEQIDALLFIVMWPGLISIPLLIAMATDFLPYKDTTWASVMYILASASGLRDTSRKVDFKFSP